MIAIILEMCGIPSLAFAVGVYLPLASSSPIWIGGLIRWLVDRYLRVKFRHQDLSELELTAEGDKSPGVLLASGYIAGGAVTGILIALKELVPSLRTTGEKIDRLAGNAQSVLRRSKRRFAFVSPILPALPVSFSGRARQIAEDPAEARQAGLDKSANSSPVAPTARHQL